MIAIRIAPYYGKLRQRRGVIVKTLEHVQQEQREIDENKEWIDKAAYASRTHLLNNLAEWYLNESDRIDGALIRIAEGNYGVCLACHETIAPERLAAIPETALCAQCQEAREALNLS
jgi:RNA polymerase-binding transcription factor DksA